MKTPEDFIAQGSKAVACVWNCASRVPMENKGIAVYAQYCSTCQGVAKMLADAYNDGAAEANVGGTVPGAIMGADAGEPEPEGKPEECDCCGFQTPALEHFDPSDPRKRHLRGQSGIGKWLCPLCAGTMAGVALEYPDQFPHRSFDILKSICYVGNVILAAIEKAAKEK